MCGVAPHERPSFTFNIFVLTFIAGKSIIITLIFKCGSMYATIKRFLLGAYVGGSSSSKVHAQTNSGSNSNNNTRESISLRPGEPNTATPIKSFMLSKEGIKVAQDTEEKL